MLKSQLPLIAALALTLPTFLMASWAEDFDYAEGDLFPQSDWSFTRSETPPSDPEEPADDELFVVIPVSEISSSSDEFRYRNAFLDKDGGDFSLLVRSGSGQPRAVYELPKSLQIGPGETLYFSVLTQDLGGNGFGWFAFGDNDADDPSLGFRQSRSPLVYAARARDEGGFSEQAEGDEIAYREDQPNLIIGKIERASAAGELDRVAISVNPPDHRRPAKWDSVAELATGLESLSKLWIRKGNVGGQTVYDRIRLGHSYEEVIRANPIAYRPLFGARNLARGQQAPDGLRIAKTSSGQKQPEFWLHTLPPAPMLQWRVEFSEDLQEWASLGNEELIAEKEIPHQEGLGSWQLVRHDQSANGDQPSQRGFYRVRAEVEEGAEPFPNAVTATLQKEIVYQEIDGFGASLAYTAQNITEELADLLFDETQGLGFSLARIRINFRNTDEDGTVTPNSWEWRAALKAQERGARVWASPWSANKNLKEDPKGEHGHREGSLKKEEYPTYAENLRDFITWANGQGIDLYAISPQNEPDYRFGSNESMDWEPQELYDFIAQNLRPTLDAAGYEDFPIVAPELMDWHRQNGWEAFYDHPDVDILAFHNYDWSYDFFNSGKDTRYPDEVDTDKTIWQTEISDVFSGETNTDTIEDALVWAKHIHRFLTKANGSAWHWWWFVPTSNDGSNNETIMADRSGAYSGSEPEEGELKVLKRGYGIGQFARFVRPGDQRIHLDYEDPSGEVRLSAFQGRGKVTIVAINEGEFPRGLRLDNIPTELSLVTAWLTTADDDLASQGHMRRSNQEPFEVILPAQSIGTLVFQ
ncbi:MAG: hypothetical protein LAT55_00490 [Opitutales bacterium]|nr:hypothetical protein [Opitutales bacterium]